MFLPGMVEVLRWACMGGKPRFLMMNCQLCLYSATEIFVSYWLAFLTQDRDATGPSNKFFFTNPVFYPNYSIYLNYRVVMIMSYLVMSYKWYLTIRTLKTLKNLMLILYSCLNYVGKGRHLVHVWLKKKNSLWPFIPRWLLLGKVLGIFLTKM